MTTTQKIIAFVAMLYVTGIAFSIETDINPFTIWVAFSATSGLLLGIVNSSYGWLNALCFILVQGLFVALALTVTHILQFRIDSWIELLFVAVLGYGAIWLSFLTAIAFGSYLFGRWVTKRIRTH